jgi:type I restriction enzyme M protein
MQAPKQEASRRAHLARRQKSRNNATGGNGGISELLKELWQAAVNLRGSIEPADYKRYVLPLIFLRFLSLRYEKRRAELEKMVADPMSDYHGLKRVLDDPDEYRAAGAFIVPEPARWANIVKMAQADDVKIQLDNVLTKLEDTYPDRLRGLLPRIYAGSNLSADNVRGLINLFSKDVFTFDHGREDLIGRVYEYFIGEFANSEGKRGGEYFTPVSIVKLLVAMLEPTEGSVFDPCCGSGGMFVQSDLFTKHSHRLSFFGQESKDFTHRLCRMNLFIHGIDGDVQLGNSYTDDKQAGHQFDYVLANPPFNDGAKGENGWGADKIPKDDPRLKIGDEFLPLSPRNANTMWIRHFLYHLKLGGTAGFVMATGELSNSETARLAVRKALVESGYLDCVVTLTGQLFANTQIPCSLWFLSKNRNGEAAHRPRREEILFINGKTLGLLIPGSRKQKQLSPAETERVAAVYREFKRSGVPGEVTGFCKVISLKDVRAQAYALTPGRYVGAVEDDIDDIPFDDAFPKLRELLISQLDQADLAHGQVRRVLERLSDD